MSDTAFVSLFVVLLIILGVIISGWGTSPENREPPAVLASKIFGSLVVIVGVLCVVGALGMDVSVDTGYGEVNNIGLLDKRQNLIIVGVGAALVGTMVYLFGGKRSS